MANYCQTCRFAYDEIMIEQSPGARPGDDEYVYECRRFPPPGHGVGDYECGATDTWTRVMGCDGCGEYQPEAAKPEQLSFVKYTGQAPRGVRKHHPLPWAMLVGQVVERPKVSRAHRCSVISGMRKQIEEKGWEFSISDVDGVFSVRRDK